MSVVKSSFRQKMKVMRKVRGLKQSELAEKVGLPHQVSVSEIETGKREPTEEEKSKIKDVLDIRKTTNKGVQIDKALLGKEMREKELNGIELARKTGLSNSAVSRYRRGYNNPGEDKLELICYVLGIKPERLVVGENEKGGADATGQDKLGFVGEETPSKRPKLQDKVQELEGKISVLIDEKKSLRKQLAALEKQTNNINLLDVISNLFN